MKKNVVSKIGGQAVMEGVMMRGERSMATAVRNAAGEITVESKRFKDTKQKRLFSKIPVVRGVINFVQMMYVGVGITLRSAEVAGEDYEPSAFEKKLSEKTGVDIMKVAMGFSVVLGILLAVALFVVLPEFLVGLLFKIPALASWPVWVMNLLTGFVRIGIFVAYIAGCAKVPEVKRLFMYHGAEHKTINCFEHGEELTVENVQKYSTKHKRCGTTFLFLVMLVSILVFSVATYVIGEIGLDATKIWLRTLCKIALLPIVAGLSYELLKILAKFDNPICNAIRAPGMWLQKLTTRQPDDDMVEVAIAAFKTVQNMDADETFPTDKFTIKLPYKTAREKLEKILPASEFETSDVDWILCDVLKVKRSELPLQKYVDEEHLKKAEKLAKERATHRPLQYVLGYQDFYGQKITVSEGVLVPRPETEILAKLTAEIAENKKVLDLCTGSGAIAVAVKKLCPAADVTASDVSEKALEIASYNASLNDAEVKFVLSDVFANVVEKYDVIVSNPPYIPTADIEKLDKEVKDFEPKIALDGGADGLEFYREIAKGVKEHLTDGGTLLLEFGIGQENALTDIFKEVFSDVRTVRDFQDIPRILILK